MHPLTSLSITICDGVHILCHHVISSPVRALNSQGSLGIKGHIAQYVIVIYSCFQKGAWSLFLSAGANMVL